MNHEPPSRERLIVSFRTNIAWLHEVCFLNPNWFLWVFSIRGELKMINFSSIWAKQFEIEMGRMLFISLESFLLSLRIGLMIETFNKLGILFDSTRWLKNSVRQCLNLSVAAFFYHKIRYFIISLYMWMIHLTNYLFNFIKWEWFFIVWIFIIEKIFINFFFYFNFLGR